MANRTRTNAQGTPRRRTGNGGGGGSEGGQANGSNVYHEARREFHLMMAPYLHAIRRAGRQAKHQTNQTVQRVGDIGSALSSSLDALNAPYQSQIAGIGSNLTQNINDLAPMLQQDIGQAPSSETAAGSNLIGTVGAGAQELLASGAARNAAYNTSAQRQGAEETAITQRNALTDLGNYRQDLSQQRIDALSQAPAQIKQLVSDLQQRDFSKFLAMQQLALSKSGNALSWDQYRHMVNQDDLQNTYWQQWIAMHNNNG